MSRCAERWPTLAVKGTPHRCELPDGHEGLHVCVCKATYEPGDPS